MLCIAKDCCIGVEHFPTFHAKAIHEDIGLGYCFFLGKLEYIVNLKLEYFIFPSLCHLLHHFQLGPATGLLAGLERMAGWNRSG